MRKQVGTFLFGALFMLSCAADSGDTGNQAQQPVEEENTLLAVGEVAPKFELRGSLVKGFEDKRNWTLDEAIEKGPVLLAFFPMAFTAG